MQDGSQSVISIRIEAELDKVDSLAKKFDVLKTGAKDLDYQFRQGKIGADQLKTGLADLQERGEALNGTYKQMTDLNATLFQVNQRAFDQWQGRDFGQFQRAGHHRIQDYISCDASDRDDHRKITSRLGPCQILP